MFLLYIYKPGGYVKLIQGQIKNRVHSNINTVLFFSLSYNLFCWGCTNPTCYLCHATKQAIGLSNSFLCTQITFYIIITFLNFFSKMNFNIFDFIYVSVNSVKNLLAVPHLSLPVLISLWCAVNLGWRLLALLQDKSHLLALLYYQ